MLNESVESGNVQGALETFDAAAKGSDPWEIHQALFPVVQGVLNPPFINPHLPKMYAILREFLPLMDKEVVTSLVRVEVQEYARRPKLPEMPTGSPERGATFGDIEASLTKGEPAGTARLMAGLWQSAGAEEFGRRLLLLGSGYLRESLGHSISCTAFILLEAMERSDQDLWPVFSTLADYYHKGNFQKTPPLNTEPVPEEEMEFHLLRAASGRGIVDLHDTITIYAMDRIRPLFPAPEYNHLVRSWIAYLEDKRYEPVAAPSGVAAPEDYLSFLKGYATRDAQAVLPAAVAKLKQEGGRELLGSYLIRGACDLYNGEYNPHQLTGLGSLLWVLERYPHNRQLVLNALYQYIDYFFSEF